MATPKLLKQSIIILWSVITTSLIGTHLLQHQLPAEIQHLAYAEPGHTYSVIALVSSLVLLFFTSFQLLRQKSSGRLLLLISMIGFLVSDYFSASKIDYYGMGTLANVAKIALGAFVALVYSQPCNQLFTNKLRNEKTFNLATREHLLLMVIIAIISYIYSGDFITTSPEIVSQYLRQFDDQKEILSIIFLVFSQLYLISAILLNSGVRLLKYIFIISTLMTYLILDMLAVTATEGGWYAVVAHIGLYATGALLAMIFCPPLSDFFSSKQHEHKIFTLGNKNVLIEAWVKIRGYFLIFWASYLLSVIIIVLAVALLHLLNYALQFNPAFEMTLPDKLVNLVEFAVTSIIAGLLIAGIKIQAIHHMEQRPVKISQLFACTQYPFLLILFSSINAVLALIPGGFIIAILLMFTDVLILEKNMDLFKAIYTSFHLVKNNILQLVGISIIYLLAILIPMSLFLILPTLAAILIVITIAILALPFMANLYALLFLKYTAR